MRDKRVRLPRDNGTGIGAPQEAYQALYNSIMAPLSGQIASPIVFPWEVKQVP